MQSEVDRGEDHHAVAQSSVHILSIIFITRCGVDTAEPYQAKLTPSNTGRKHMGPRDQKTWVPLLSLLLNLQYRHNRTLCVSASRKR